MISEILIRFLFVLFFFGFVFSEPAPPATQRDGEIVLLSPENFNPTIKDGFWFIKFFDKKDCPECASVEKVWRKFAVLAKEMGAPFRVAEHNCENSDSPICLSNNIIKVPTLMMFYRRVPIHVALGHDRFGPTEDISKYSLKFELKKETIYQWAMKHVMQMRQAEAKQKASSDKGL